MPRVSPAARSNETSETACTTPPLSPPAPRTANSWTTLRTSSRVIPALRPCRGSSRPTSGRPRVRANGGRLVRHCGVARAHRGSNAQPDGSAVRSGGWPGVIGSRACDWRSRRGIGLQQRAGVGHPHLREQGSRRRVLHGTPGVHDDHVVGVAGGQPEVVADQDDRGAEPGAQLAEQVHDLRLGGHVQRGGRLVGDQQLRVRGERDRDHHPLAHATGELVRVLVEPPSRVRYPDQRQQLDRARCGRRPSRPGRGRGWPR